VAQHGAQTQDRDSRPICGTALHGKHYFGASKTIWRLRSYVRPVDAEHMSAAFDGSDYQDPIIVNELLRCGAWRLFLIFGGDRVVHHVSLRLPTRTCKPVTAPCGGELLPTPSQTFRCGSIRRSSSSPREPGQLVAERHRNQPRRLLRQQPDKSSRRKAPLRLPRTLSSESPNQHLPYVSVPCLVMPPSVCLRPARVLSRREAEKGGEIASHLNTLGSGTLAAITEAMLPDAGNLVQQPAHLILCDGRWRFPSPDRRSLCRAPQEPEPEP